MTIRVYLMPTIGTGDTLQDLKRPKYLTTVASVAKSCLRYGPEPVCLMTADTNAAMHSTLTANADVRAFPDNLDTVVSDANRVAIVNALEAANVPAHWVANGQTFRVVLRRLAGIFLLLQNVDGRGMRFLQQSLDSQLSALPVGVRTAMQDAATALQVSTTGITLSTTLRTALAAIGAQFEARPLIALRTSL